MAQLGRVLLWMLICAIPYSIIYELTNAAGLSDGLAEFNSAVKEVYLS